MAESLATGDAAEPTGTELPFAWPVLGISRDHGWGTNFLVSFPDAVSFNRARLSELQRNDRIGMLLFDLSGRSWEILAIRAHPETRSMFQRWLGTWGDRLCSIEVDLVEREPVSYDELVEKVLETIDANPEEFIQIYLFADDLPRPPTEQAFLEEIKDRARRARSLPELIEFMAADPPP